DLGVFLADLEEDVAEHLTAVKHVVLHDRGDPLFAVLRGAAVTLAAKLEGEADDLFARAAGDHAGVDGDLRLTTGGQLAARRRVEVLGVLADDHHVDLAGLPDRLVAAMNAVLHP